MSDIEFRPPVMIGTTTARTPDGLIEVPEYEPVNIDGARLRRTRESLGHTLGTAAQATGLSFADIGAIENSHAWVDEAAYVAALSGNLPTPR